eukprot:4919216-Pleurochrysis_carterae.AAC.1
MSSVASWFACTLAAPPRRRRRCGRGRVVHPILPPSQRRVRRVSVASSASRASAAVRRCGLANSATCGNKASRAFVWATQQAKRYQLERLAGSISVFSGLVLKAVCLPLSPVHITICQDRLFVRTDAS